MKLKKIEYEILDECKCGPEELFVLISSINYNSQKEIDVFFKSLLRLIKHDYLICTSNNDKIDITRLNLNNYLSAKLENQESLEEHSDVVEEYSFETTEDGLKFLKDEDNPTNLIEYDGKKIALVVYYIKNNKKEVKVFSGFGKWKGNHLYFIRKNPNSELEIQNEWIERIKLVESDLKDILFNADYSLPLLLGDIPEGESEEHFINTGLNW